MTRRQIWKSIGMTTRRIRCLAELGDLMVGSVGNHHRWIPTQTEVQGETAVHLEVVLQVPAVEVSRQVIVGRYDLGEPRRLSVQEIHHVVAGKTGIEVKSPHGLEVLLQDGVFSNDVNSPEEFVTSADQR